MLQELLLRFSLLLTAFIPTFAAVVIRQGVLGLDVTEVDIGVGDELVGLVVVIVVDGVVVVVVVVIIFLRSNNHDSSNIGKYYVSAPW